MTHGRGLSKSLPKGVGLVSQKAGDGRDVAPLEGRYANYFEIGQNATEFLLDFGQFYPEDEKANLHTRIITSPIYARMLFDLLGEAIERYQEEFGTIERGL